MCVGGACTFVYVGCSRVVCAAYFLCVACYLSVGGVSGGVELYLSSHSLSVHLHVIKH